MSGFEKNRNSLKDALNRMRSYEPPADGWSKLEAGLNETVTEEDETPLANG